MLRRVLIREGNSWELSEAFNKKRWWVRGYLLGFFICCSFFLFFIFWICICFIACVNNNRASFSIRRNFFSLGWYIYVDKIMWRFINMLFQVFLENFLIFIKTNSWPYFFKTLLFFLCILHICVTWYVLEIHFF